MEALQKGDPEVFDLEKYSKVGRAAKEGAGVKKWTVQDKKLENILVRKSDGGRHRIKRLAETVAWMLTMPIRLNGTVLTPTEFCDNHT